MDQNDVNSDGRPQEWDADLSGLNQYQRTLIEVIVSGATGLLKQDGELSPVFFLGMEQHLAVIDVHRFFVSPAGKEAAAAAARKSARALNAGLFAMVAESWRIVRKAGTPLPVNVSEQPDRVECVVFAVETARAHYLGIADISRDSGAPELQPVRWTRATPGNTDSRFAGVIPLETQ